MKTKLLLILASVGMLAASVACSGDDTNGEPGTKSAEDVKIVLKTSWPGDVPSKYSSIVNGTKAELSGEAAEFPGTFDPGTYHYLVYNTPSGIAVNGSLATVSDNDGYALSPGWLYAASGDITVDESGEDKQEFSIAATPKARQLNMTLTFAGGSPGEVTGLTAELSGAACSIDLETGEVSGNIAVRPEFTLSEGAYKATHNLLGVVGNSQIIKMNITLPGGAFEVKGDLSEALAGFNGDRTTALNVSLQVSNMGLSSATLEVTAWEEGEIQSGSREEPQLGVQIAIDWPGRAGDIRAVEFFNKDMLMFTSPVENGRTTSLYELPEEIYMMNVFSQNKMEDVTLNIFSYDNQTGALKMDDKYVISDPRHLTIVKDMEGDYRLANDIDCAGWTIDPIGYYVDMSDFESFRGTFDGAGFKIENLSLTKQAYCGLFAMNEGTIKNLHIASGELGDNATIVGIGAICGLNAGRVEDCVNGAQIAGNMYVGAIVGANAGEIVNCTNNGKVIGTSTVGGIAGVNNNAVLSCKNTGEIAGMVKVGGLVGENQGRVADPVNEGAVSAMSTGCGGIVGSNNKGDVTNAENKATVKGAGQTGGVVGTNIGNIDGCANTGAVTGSSPVGGIAGMSTGSSNVADCANEGAITSTGNQCGGIIGSNLNSVVNGCMNLASATVTCGNQNGGGIVGQGSTSSRIYNCGNYGAVTATGYNLGGIAGQNQGAMIACMNAGQVGTTNEQGTYVGGIMGQCSAYMNTTACYNTGKVYGFSNVAGIIGYHNNASTATAVFSVGEIDGGNTGRTGAIAGYNLGNAKIVASYWDVAPRDIGQNANVNVDQVEVLQFHYDAENPSATVWPVEDHAKGWGIASGGNGFAEGYYWKSLGDASTATYPKLWWETAPGGVRPKAVKRMQAAPAFDAARAAARLAELELPSAGNM